MIAGMLGEMKDAFKGSMGGWVNGQQSVAELWHDHANISATLSNLFHPGKKAY